MSVLMELKGTTGIIIAYDDRVVISRKSAGGFFSQGGYLGDRTYYYSDINSVEYKKPTMMANGYIKFIVAGTQETNAKLGLFSTSVESARDQNTIILRAFNKNTPRESEELYDLIMDKIGYFKSIDTQSIQTVTASSKMDELKKLADLKERNILTEEEFLTEKARILNS